MGKGKDFVRKTTSEALQKAFRKYLIQKLRTNAGQPGTGRVGCLNATRTKVKFSDGSEFPCVVVGNPTQCCFVQQIQPGVYIAIGPKPAFTQVDGGQINGYLILQSNTVDGDGLRPYYIGKITTDELELYRIPISTVLGVPQIINNFYHVRFTPDGSGVFVGEIGDVTFTGNNVDPLSGSSIKHHGFGLGFSLSKEVDAPIGDVSFSSTTHYSVALGPDTLPVPTPPSGPGVPDTTPNGVSYSLETDPTMLSFGENTESATASFSYNIYQNPTGIFKADLFGSWTVTRNRSSMFNNTSATLDNSTLVFMSTFVDPGTTQLVRPFSVQYNSDPPTTYNYVNGVTTIPGLPNATYLAFDQPYNITNDLRTSPTYQYDSGQNAYYYTGNGTLNSSAGYTYFWTDTNFDIYSFSSVAGVMSNQLQYTKQSRWDNYVDSGRLYFKTTDTISGTNYISGSAFKSLPVAGNNILSTVGGLAFGGSIFDNGNWVHPALDYFVSSPSETVGPAFDRIVFTNTHYIDSTNRPSAWSSVLTVHATDSELFQTYRVFSDDTTDFVEVESWKWNVDTNSPNSIIKKNGPKWNTGLYDLGVLDWYAKR